MNRTFLFLSALLTLLTAGRASAQQPDTVYNLDPTHWFPLELGSYWHYDAPGLNPLQGEDIRKAVADTLFDDRRWTRISVVWCNNSSNECWPQHRWYAWTEDAYLLSSVGRDLGSSSRDTVFATTPRSPFTVNVPHDTTLKDQVCPDADVLIEPNPNAIGNESDTTRLLLRIYPFCLNAWDFVYNIGPEDELRGAIVNGRRWGNTAAIDALVLASDLEEVELMFSLSAYPVPSSGPVSIEVHPHVAGLHRLTIYDLLGREVFTEEASLAAGQIWQVEWNRSGVAGGVYLLRAKDPHGRNRSTRIVLTR